MRPCRKLIPSAVTLAGLGAGLAGAWLIAHGQPVAALFVLGLGQIFDLLDGWLARRFGAVSDIGARLDWSCDCAVAVAVYVALGCWAGVVLAALLQALTWSGVTSSPSRISGRSGAVVLALAFVALGLVPASGPLDFSLRCSLGAP
ncbi:CDP-alcohol phosphatidyltransferase family protein [Nannocystis bainbridge]|uniref:CDP-alcohol phosphatidyltransferase family protein n=1 Tax=Nannocystis bainbridge TaxID=2995303 RepID=A0ABT5E297_9BACT|nr:CDP-alcohol phosphatidyltransferase family protein [Nannocystis bainbridge]MDC0719931.1 CDP-alcohol phosphatidyltransferase family protein [Nannocystis bainbridge]